ncbi:hypothetical protein NLJ89_g3649 [Agrocybe chaxingu]|uniref:F-box domain-containing protein n=1 Tax=Agrocybe chaxingu TaxID=84603 RepID=A0A9W8KAS2_9AGAR|nr:hypothetical protein NLJ89_g3649 [Agrocybe chaxingu]
MASLSYSKMGICSGAMADLSFSFSVVRVAQKVEDARQSSRPSPISRLPVELLCGIFHKYLEIPSKKPCADPDRHSTGPQVSRASHTDPSLLTQICSHWRNIALNLPTLWSTIFIREPKQSQLELTRLWLERAKEAPLSLAIWQTPVASEIDVDATWEILSEFVARSNQWKKIDFQLPSTVIPPFHQMMQDRNCNNLESIDFHVTEVVHPGLVMTSRENRWEAQLEDLWKTFLSSPSLRDVTWHCLPPGGPPSETVFSHLTSVNIAFDISVDDFLRILSLTPNLQRAQAALAIPSSHSSPSSPLSLASLHTLQLSTRIELSEILPKIIAPSLTNLNVVVDESIVSCGTVNPLQDFLQKSRCRLTSFTLVDRNISSEAVESCFDLPELQSLTYLRLEGKLPEKAVGHLLEAQNGSYTRMPLLQHIYVGTAWGRLVSTRWHSLPYGQPDDCEKMERFTMCSNRFHTTMDHEFQAMKDRGLPI